MKRWDCVAIIGVGLIGGSIGLALRSRKLSKEIVGIGRRENSLTAAKNRGCIDRGTTSIPSGVKNAGLIVVCTPVELVPRHVAEAGHHCPEGSIITDAGSTKSDLVMRAESSLADRFPRHLPFVGSHPIAGSEKSGPEAADGDLFEGRVVVVTESEVSDLDVVDTVEEFWQSLGARVVRMSPEEHDAALARTSHLPHLVASALAAATPKNLLELAAGGFADTTRIAAGDVELWRQIFLANRGHTLKALADFERVLSRLRQALEMGDGAALAQILTEGKRRRDALGS
ncbi:MAG: prephenate dehydrogenase/arogenate dehydrogenase family protein [Pirellulaceae bacterium]|nr:prephenate dehydrogenase/arogenate dehydrogenase family protein [Pirellulaceae bacterium]